MLQDNPVVEMIVVCALYPEMLFQEGVPLKAGQLCRLMPTWYILAGNCHTANHKWLANRACNIDGYNKCSLSSRRVQSVRIA